MRWCAGFVITSYSIHYTKLYEEISRQDLRHFYTRLGANFYAIHSLFDKLYGRRPDFAVQAQRLVETMARQYIQRPEHLRELDLAREKDYNWFLSQEWVGMALYCGGFAGNLQGLRERLHYFQELGVNLVHIMPIIVITSYSIHYTKLYDQLLEVM